MTGVPQNGAPEPPTARQFKFEVTGGGPVTLGVMPLTSPGTAMATYYAYHLQFPSTSPYDSDEFRWPSFLGEFLAPILRQHPQLQCCASYYVKHAEFYAYTDDFAAIQPSIETLESLGFTAKNMNRTLEENFGSGRFLGSDSASDSTRRAELILAMLRSFSDLLVDSVYRRDDGYWTFEQTADKSQNPIGNHFYVCARRSAC